MAEVSIAAEARSEFGKGAARRVRRAHKVPAVLYGHGTPPRHVSLPGHELNRALKSANVLLRLEGLEGGNELALPKAVQRDAVIRRSRARRPYPGAARRAGHDRRPADRHRQPDPRRLPRPAARLAVGCRRGHAHSAEHRDQHPGSPDRPVDSRRPGQVARGHHAGDRPRGCRRPHHRCAKRRAVRRRACRGRVRARSRGRSRRGAAAEGDAEEPHAAASE